MDQSYLDVFRQDLDGSLSVKRAVTDGSVVGSRSTRVRQRLRPRLMPIETARTSP